MGRISGCRGDSGGPYVCNINNRWELHGAVSWGESTCSSSYYSVFANIYFFKDWIKNTIANTAPVTLSPNCRDKDANCPQYKRHCQTSAQMRSNCCATCGGAPTTKPPTMPPTTAPSCKDNYHTRTCTNWKKYCKISSFVRINCCGTCADA